MSTLSEIVCKWESAGHVERLDKPALFCNPMSIKAKNKADGSVKHRPCIDLSRSLNIFLKPEHCALDTLHSTESVLNRGDFLCSFDLKDMYFHVEVAEQFRTFLGFSCLIDDNETFFQFTKMPFGLRSAVNIVTRLCKPLKSFLHSLGIVFSLYIDDARISSPNYTETLFKTKLAVLVFSLAGWRLNFDKSILVPTQKIRYLGFITDTNQFKFFCPEDRIREVKDSVMNVINILQTTGRVPAKDLAATLGKISALSKSHGQFCAIVTRSAQHMLGKLVAPNNDWTVHIPSSRNIFAEFHYFLDNIDFFNGQSIMNHNNNVSFQLAETQMAIDDISHSTGNFKNLYVSDSSDTHSFVYSAENFRIVNEFSFSDTEREMSSTYRELLAISKTLPLRFKEPFSFHTNIYWQTDSHCSSIVLNKGSRVEVLQQQILEIKKMERLFNFTLIPVWTSRWHTRLQMADAGSKLFLQTSTDEWGVARPQLHGLFRLFDFWPTIDAMASDSNAICPSFYSVIPQLHNSGVNIFCQRLQCSEKYFFCPPISLINATWQFIHSQPNISAIFIIPVWTSANYWPTIFNGSKFAHSVRDFTYFSPRFINTGFSPNNVFHKKPKFDMLALKVVT